VVYLYGGGDQELKCADYANVAHGNHNETQGTRLFYTISGLMRVKAYVQFLTCIASVVKYMVACP
jgi:hypothetical protein